MKIKRTTLMRVTLVILLVMTTSLIFAFTIYRSAKSRIDCNDLAIDYSLLVMEPSSTFSDEYEKLGLIYDNNMKKYCFEGKTVRCFADNQNFSDYSHFEGVMFTTTVGEIDLISIRDDTGKLLKLEALDINNTAAYINAVM